jgi:hypothetical protein
MYLSASYSELTGQPTPSQTTVLTTTEMLVSETMAPLVTGTETTEIVPSLVASTDPPMIGTLQAQVTETATLVATTSSAIAPELQLADPHTVQIQTTSLPRAPTEGQHDSSESEGDTSQFLLTLRSSAPNSTASIPPSSP